jgi:hypothetical protein
MPGGDLPRPGTSDTELLDWARAQPPVTRGTVEESLQRSLESGEQTRASAKLLSDVMQAKLSKDPALAAKQARLLEKIKRETTSAPSPEMVDQAEAEAFAKNRQRQCGKP